MAFLRHNVQVSDAYDVVHTYDTAAALDALREALSLDPEAAEGRPYRDQLAYARRLYEAVGRFYQSANVPPPSDPLYVDHFARWYCAGGGAQFRETVGGSGALPIDPNDPAWGRVNGIGPSIASGTGGSEIRHRVDGVWNRLGRSPTYAHILIRLELDERGRVIEVCDTGRDGSGVCDFGSGTLYIGCVREGASGEGCDPYDWHSLAWSDDPFPTGYQKLLCPLRWFADFAFELAHLLAARVDPFGLDPVEGCIGASARYVALANLDTVVRYNLNPDQSQRALQAQLSSDLQAAQSATGTAAAQNIAAAGAVASATFAAMAAAAGVSATTGPWGVVLGAIILVVGFIYRYVLPMAVAGIYDRFGRLVPSLLIASIPSTERTGNERQIVAHSTYTPPESIDAPRSTSFDVGGPAGAQRARFKNSGPPAATGPTLTILPNAPPESSSSGSLLVAAAIGLALIAASGKGRR